MRLDRNSRDFDHSGLRGANAAPRTVHAPVGPVRLTCPRFMYQVLCESEPILHPQATAALRSAEGKEAGGLGAEAADLWQRAPESGAPNSGDSDQARSSTQRFDK
jgi:hypothetical protein